jgi:hypothetical protein
VVAVATTKTVVELSDCGELLGATEHVVATFACDSSCTVSATIFFDVVSTRVTLCAIYQITQHTHSVPYTT